MAVLIPSAARTATGLPGLTSAGAPSAGTDEVQTISSSGTPTGGTFKLSFKGQRTAALDFDASAAEIDAALGALSTIGGAANVTCAGGALPTDVTVTFTGALAKKAVPLLTVVESALTGGTDPEITVAETTPGVTATHRGAPKGAQLVDTTNGIAYINTGSATSPTWTKIGTQV